jgi:hypothetical protein
MKSLEMLVKEFKEEKNKEKREIVFNLIEEEMKKRINTWANGSRKLQMLLCCSADDLVSEAYLVLLRCVENYNSIGNFSTYFWNSIKKFAFKVEQDNNMQKRAINSITTNASAFDNGEQVMQIGDMTPVCENYELDSSLLEEVLGYIPDSIDREYVTTMVKGYSQLEALKVLKLNRSQLRKVNIRLKRDDLLKGIFSDRGLLNLNKNLDSQKVCSSKKCRTPLKDFQAYCPKCGKAISVKRSRANQSLVMA